MTLIDSVNTVFLVKHRGCAMHFEGYANEQELAEHLLFQVRLFDAPDERLRAIDELASRVKERVTADAYEGPDEEET